MSQPAAALPRQVSAFTLITPIKQGFVPDRPTLRYVDRLRKTLEILQDRIAGRGDNLLDLIKTVHFAHWAILEDSRGDRLLFSSVYVGQLEQYLKDFSTRVAGGLDLVWGHCEGYPGAACFDAFCGWIEEHRVKPSCFYAAHPGVTVVDVGWLSAFHARYLGTLREVQQRPEAAAALIEELERDAVRLDVPEAPLADQVYAMLQGLGRLKEVFSPAELADATLRTLRAFGLA